MQPILEKIAGAMERSIGHLEWDHPERGAQERGPGLGKCHGSGSTQEALRGPCSGIVR